MNKAVMRYRKLLFREPSEPYHEMNWDHCQSCDVFYLVELGCFMCEQKRQAEQTC